MRGTLNKLYLLIPRRRSAVRVILLLYFVFEVLSIVYPNYLGGRVNAGRGVALPLLDVVGAAHPSGQLVGLALIALLTLCVYRGSRAAWTVLLVLNGLAVIMTGVAAVMSMTLYMIGLLVLCSIALLVLISPVVRRSLKT